MGWLLLLLLLLAIGLFAAYRWVRANGSIETLDTIDHVFTGDIEPHRVQFGDDPAQHLYVYSAGDQLGQPILVFIHGGSWSDGAPEPYGFIGRNFAPEGYVVVLAGYRLGEAGRFPAMLEDSAAAIAWTYRHAEEIGGDPGRIVLMGHSAGAYNAAMVALDRQWLGREALDPNIVSAVIGLAGPYDFYPFDKDSTRNAFDHWARPEATQPINFVHGGAPPFLLITGDADETVRPRNSRALSAGLEEAGSPVELLEIEGMDHVGPLIHLAQPLTWWDGRTKQAALDFMAKTFDPATPSASVKGAGP